MFNKHTHRLAIFFILLIAAFLRFYNLMHDSPYFFNPDERNMASAITRFRLPTDNVPLIQCFIEEFTGLNRAHREEIFCNLNPHFFAYGQFPLYLAFASDNLTRAPLAVLQGVPLEKLYTSFPSAIFWLRFWSALYSTITVLLVYLISRQFLTLNFSLLTAALAAFTPGLIQSAHFGTTESLLTFFFLFSIYVSVSYLSNLGHLRFILFMSLAIGLSLGSKLTGLFFFVPPFLSLMIRIIELFRKKMTPIKRSRLLLGYWAIGLMILIGSIFISILSSPYNLVEKENFLSAVFGYEADVASGKFPAFYTRQFIGPQPIFFQIEKIFPYQLGWPVFLMGSIGFMLINFQLIVFLLTRFQMFAKSLKLIAKRCCEKFKDFNSPVEFFVLSFSFLAYFLPNAFLFAKWTRFMTPLLPFFSIFAGYLFFKLSQSTYKKRWEARNGIIALLVIISILPGLAFFSIYTHEDSRVTASRWIYENIPDGSYILSETANVVDIPLHLSSRDQPATNDYTVVSFDFYHLNENPALREDLYQHLSRADYILIPSRRIFANHLPHPDLFPQASRYYQLLFSGELGFEKVAKIESFPQLSINNLPAGKAGYQLTIPDEQSEETSTVFDHPVIRIYRKTRQMDTEGYRMLLEG